MATKTTRTTRTTGKETEASAAPRIMIQPGERGVLLSHIEYRWARKQGLGLKNYDLVMRQPEEAKDEDNGSLNAEVWVPVPASKYLKHRANGWREAESLEELPANWLDDIGDRDPFEPDKPEEGGE